MITKRLIWLYVLLLCSMVSMGQQKMPSISELRWGRDYNLHVKLSNDTNYVMDVRALYHTDEFSFDSESESATFYPVSLDEDFINHLKTRKLEIEEQSLSDSAVSKQQPSTLWSALHGTLGGGYVHFVNCLVYAIESQHLSLSDPIMIRPQSKWKPKPVTQSYKRTKKWSNYIPYDQNLAQREYKLRKRENDMKDLQGVPSKFLNLFLETSQKDYEMLASQGKRMQIAQIDLVRLLLGTKYLGISQIEYIQQRVTSSILLYSKSNLPSIIIFDDYKAAVAMTLDRSGYKIDYVVFQDQDVISSQEYEQRFTKIEAFIATINEANDKVFRRRLSTYYGS
ncbi:MAG: hypothetical protein WC951_00255 [Bacteroidales bacterium]